MLNTVIISDLHISAGPQDDCDPVLEDHLCCFLDYITHAYAPVELIINGDFLDFVQATPHEPLRPQYHNADGLPLSFSQHHSLRKLEHILTSHPRIWRSLHKLLSSHAGNCVVIIPGNHDADLFWPEVNTRLRSAISPPTDNSLHILSDRVYRPQGSPHCWVEHGHQFDPANHFFVNGKEYWSAHAPPIFTDTAGTPRLLECLGTRFLTQFLNILDQSYPFVNNVKPFSRFLKTFGLSCFHPQHGPLQAAIAIWRFTTYMATSNVSDVLEAPTLQQTLQVALVHKLRRELSTMTALAQSALLQSAYADNAISAPISDLVTSSHSESLTLLHWMADHIDHVPPGPDSDPGTLGYVPGELGLASGFTRDETAALKTAAASIITQHGAPFVIMGHTHEHVCVNAYINTGTWIRNMTPDTSQSNNWDILRHGSNFAFPYSLHYVHCTPTTTTVHLFRDDTQ